MAPLAIPAIIAGGGLMAYGQYQQGQAAAAQGKMEQDIMDYNAKIKEREAAAELERSRAEAAKFSKEGEELQGRQQVSLAKGGVLTATGSPALLLEETAQNLESDRRMILREGLLSESFRMSEAEGLRYQGRAAKASGLNARIASRYAAAGTILSTIGTVGVAKSLMSGTTAGAGSAGSTGVRSQAIGQTSKGYNIGFL